MKAKDIGSGGSQRAVIATSPPTHLLLQLTDAMRSELVVRLQLLQRLLQRSELRVSISEHGRSKSVFVLGLGLHFQVNVVLLAQVLVHPFESLARALGLPQLALKVSLQLGRGLDDRMSVC